MTSTSTRAASRTLAVSPPPAALPAAPLAAVLAAVLAVAWCAPAAGQVVGRDEAPLPEVVDSADVHGRARREQAQFERRRNRLLPWDRGFARGGSDCDEIVGRFCLWFDEGSDDETIVEPEGVGPVRDALIAYLDSVQALVPSDGWILGQRVWYRVEAGRWGEALRDARRCGEVERWWCAALEGLALHGLGRYEEAAGAFDRALAGMDPDDAVRWREPRRVLHSGVRGLLDDAGKREDGDGGDGGEGDGGVGGEGGRADFRDRLWRLADPSYLVAGNDRLTEHYARWTVARIREDARNPYQIAWGRDLEELLVRFGWEVGWERVHGAGLGDDGVVGHQHPAGREYIPGREGLRDPAAAAREDLQPGWERPRSLYTPAYAPVILPMDGQLAAFPRGDRLVVIATTFVPADTTFDPGDAGERPWMEAGDQDGLPDRAGLFLVRAEGGGPTLERTRVGPGDARLLLEAPAGAWVASAEAWSPPARIGGRTRVGVRRDTVPPDVATLSDLLLVDGGAQAPATLEDAAARARIHRALGPTESVGVVWELGGLGWEATTVGYDLALEAADEGLLRRLGQRLGLVDRSRPLELTWEEPGPERPSTMLRHVTVELPDVDPGRYRLRLRARVTGRGDLLAATEVEIRP